MLLSRSKRKRMVRLLTLLTEKECCFMSGLCSLVLSLRSHDVITIDEHSELQKYIRENRPKSNFGFNKHYDVTHSDSSYYWKHGEWQPRLAWLQSRIKKLS